MNSRKYSGNPVMPQKYLAIRPTAVIPNMTTMIGSLLTRCLDSRLIDSRVTELFGSACPFPREPPWTVNSPSTTLGRQIEVPMRSG